MRVLAVISILSLIAIACYLAIVDPIRPVAVPKDYPEHRPKSLEEACFGIPQGYQANCRQSMLQYYPELGPELK